MSDSPEQIEAQLVFLKRQFERERKSRLEAEAISEQVLRGLYDKQREIELLLSIADAANDAISIEDVLQLTLNQVCNFTGWPIGHAFLASEETPAELVSTKLWHLGDPKRFSTFREITEKMGFVSGSGLPGRVLATGKPAWVMDVRADTNFPRRDLAQKLGICAGFAFPVLIGTSVAAVLEFFSEETLEPNASLLEIMRHLGSQLGRVVERQRSQRELLRSEAYFRRLTDNSLDLITILDADGTIRYESNAITEVLGYSPEEYRGKNAFQFVHPEDLPEVSEAFKLALEQHGNTPLLNFRFHHKDGSWRVLEGVGNNLLSDPVVAGIVFNSRDVTERIRLEEQFRQSQKVQAIGQLAGGVAHDFNNILTAIIGYCELMMKRLPPGELLFNNATEIKKAAVRAAGLTRQLLAFSRKQLLQPKVLDLNAVVTDMDKMLRRLLGEQIDFVTIAHPSLGRVKADPGQIEQVLMNLAVNARDAMPEGGKLTIETDNVTLDPSYAKQRSEVIPGDHVMLAVSDNGSGMTAEVQVRLFEPFFTTKEPGKGTGLGLATCHGIVKQSGGHIAVYSELGRGTTFKVFLPRVADAMEEIVKPETPTETPGGRETVLLVEDEPMLRELGLLILGDLGYRVFAADNGVYALRFFQENAEEKIDVVISDVIMPEMGGKELADRLKEISPTTKVIFCSGYTQDAIARDGVLDPGVAFIQKPYTVDILARKVREVLKK